MARKKPAKKQPECHHFDFKTKKQYIIVNGKRSLIKKSDPRFRDWPKI